MTKLLLKTARTTALCAALFSLFAPAYAGPAEATDQVAASFDRLLTHTLATTAVALPAASKAEADPMIATVNAVLWKQPSYHLPAKSVFLLVKPEQKQ